MLDLSKHETRILIATGRHLAYSGKSTEALNMLEEFALAPGTDPVDRAAALSTKAELLFLNREYVAAEHVFKQLEPLLNTLPHAVAVTLEFNRVDVASSMFDSEGISRFYDLVDEMRVAGMDHWDASALLTASRQAAKGKSYESLPAIWRELVRTYRQGRWSAFRDASRYMAEECIRLGALSEAAFHAAIAGDSNVAKQISSILLASRNTETVIAVLRKLIATANLRSHFTIACNLIQAASDAVPEQLSDEIVHWIVKRCGGDKEPEDRWASAEIAWKTIESLVGRCTAETALAVVKVATTHHAWLDVPKQPSAFIRLREQLIDAVNKSVSALPIDALGELADAAIPIATDRQNFKDFTNSVNLLGHIVFRSSEPVKTRIRDALYPKGTGIPPVLMQLAQHFGVEIPNKDDQLENYAKAVTTNLGNVVQRVPTGQAPIPVNGTVMTWTAQKGEETVLVHYISGDDIRAMARNRQQFSQQSLHDVVGALAKNISDPDNILENKITFIDCIKDFADVLDRELALEVFEVLAPIAGGQIEQSGDVPDRERQNHPLSRTQVNSVTTAQVTGHALFSLSRIEACLPDVYGDRLRSIVEPALSSSSPAIRKSAFAAVREIPTLSESTWMPVIMGTRDPDVNAASLAFDAISNKKEARLTRPQWRMLVYALRTAQMHVSASLRRAAASALTALITQAPNEKTRQDLDEIRQLFANDIAYSVRTAAKRDE